MTAQQHETVWTFFLVSGQVNAGQVVCFNASRSGAIVATAANRTAAGRLACGIAITSADADANLPAFECQVVGPLDPTIANVGAGAADESVRVSTTGTLERVASPSASDQVVGICDADGAVYLNFVGAGGFAGATLTGTTNGVLSLSGVNAGTADPNWTFPGTGRINSLYVNGTSSGILTVIGNGETPGGASLPLDGFIRVSNQLAWGPGGANSVILIAYQNNTLGTDPAVLGVYSGKPTVGDPSHFTEVDVIGDGLLFDAGAGLGGTVSSFTGEIRLACKATTSAGGFTTTYLGFQGSGAPGVGVASFDGGNPSRLRSSKGTANQVLAMNGTGTDLVWTTPAGGNPGGSSTQFQYNSSGAFAGASGLTYDGTNNRPQVPNGIAFFSGGFNAVLNCTPTAARTITIPDATDTLVNLNSAQTLTNKSIAFGQITGAYVNPGGAASAMGALAIDWSLSNLFTKTLANAGNTITFSNQASGQTIQVRFTGGGASTTVTWPTVKWPGGVAPTQTPSGTDIYTFTYDGTSVYGTYQQNMG